MYTVFDTNFYRLLASGRSTQEVKEIMPAILEAEKQKGIKSMQCTIVAQELLSHLLDAGRGTNCTNACIALYMHTGNSKEFRLIPLPEVQIAKMVFNIDWSQRIRTQETCGKILSELASTDNIAAVIAKYQKELTQIKTYIHEVEETLAGGIETLFQTFDPTYKMGDLPFGKNKELRKKFLTFIDSYTFEQETIIGLLVSMAIILQQQGYTLSHPEDIPARIRQVPFFYASAMAFRRMYFKKFSSTAYDLRKDNHSNYIWDEYILSSLGNRINDEEISIVSSDGEMNRAMHDYDPKLKIMTKDEYLSYLGISF